jgi:hypothetical protein
VSDKVLDQARSYDALFCRASMRRDVAVRELLAVSTVAS